MQSFKKMDGRVKPGHDGEYFAASRKDEATYHFSPNGRISSSKVQALRGC